MTKGRDVTQWINVTTDNNIQTVSAAMAVKQIFLNKTLALRTVFTLIVLGIYWALLYVPGPGVDSAAVAFCGTQQVNGIYAAASIVSGGAIMHLSPVAVGIMSYISASIIWMLLSRVVKPFKRKMENNPKWKGQYVFVGVVGTILSAVTAFTTSYSAIVPGRIMVGCNQIILPGGPSAAFTAGLIMTLGSMVLICVGLLVTRWGVGNGLSNFIAVGILASIPGLVTTVWKTEGFGGILLAAGAIGLLLLGIWWLSAKTYKHPLRLLPDNETAANENSLQVGTLNIPRNPAGVLPVILASIFAYGPSLIANIFPNTSIGQWLQSTVGASGSIWQLLLIGLVAILFTFYFVITNWDSDTATNLFKTKLVGITDLAPGEPTRKWYDDTLLRITTIAGVSLAVLTVVPALVARLIGLPVLVALGGVTVIVLVGCIGAFFQDLRTKTATILNMPEPEKSAWLFAGGQNQAISFDNPLIDTINERRTGETQKLPEMTITAGTITMDTATTTEEPPAEANRATRRAAKKQKTIPTQRTPEDN